MDETKLAVSASKNGQDIGQARLAEASLRT
jgi:hypothetical protein